jgi:indole-3-glycerol phosphate synthase
MATGEPVTLAGSIRARQAAGVMPVLAEIKLRSPQHGDLLRGRDPAELARVYTSQPVAGISVVTEAGGFGGSIEVLRQVRAATDRPILRKNFPATVADLAQTRDAGAQVQLLTVKMLQPAVFLRLHRAAVELGLETLVEIHHPSELALVAQLDAAPSLIGVNNRDIARGETDDGDVAHSESLLAQLPGGPPRLSESAIAGPDDARRARDAGADAILVGTAILTAPDPAAMIRWLVEVGWP